MLKDNFDLMKQSLKTQMLVFLYCRHHCLASEKHEFSMCLHVKCKSLTSDEITFYGTDVLPSSADITNDSEIEF